MKAIYDLESGVINGIFYNNAEAPTNAIDITEEQANMLSNDSYVVRYINGVIVITENVKRKAFKDIVTLKTWFNDFYTIHEQQYRRLHTLGDTTAYAKLLALYNEAEQKRALIQELEGKL